MKEKHNINPKSRFRILKGGNISLVVCALLVGVCVDVAKAATHEVNTPILGPLSIGGAGDTVGASDDLNITESGSIEGAGGPAVQAVDDFTGTISNSGDINGTRAIYLTDDGGIHYDNNGSITNESSGKLKSTQSAIVAKNNTATGTITNYGSIDADGSGIWLQVSNENDILNGGTIDAGKNGIYVGSASAANSGIIINTGTITASSSANDTYGINILGSLDGEIVNGGDIDVTSTNDDAYGISIYDGMDGEITNSGNINVASTNGDAYGIYVYGSGNSMAGTAMDGNITNSGNIAATIDGSLSKDGYSLSIDETYSHNGTGTVINNADASLRGNIMVNAALNNAGLIALPHDANGDEGNYARIKDFTNSGTLQIGLNTDGTIGGTTYSQLVVTDAVFEDESTIDVNVLSSSTNAGALAGERLDNVVEASNSLTVNGTLNVTDNSALLNFELIEDADSVDDNSTIDLMTVAGSTIHDSTVSGGGNPTANTNAQRLEDFKATDSGMDEFVAKLNTCPTDSCVAKAVDALEVKLAGAGVGAAKQTAQSIAKIVRQRQKTFGVSGLNSGEEVFNEKNIWFKPFGTWGKQKDKDGLSGYDVSSYGFGIGADGTNKDNQQFGVGLFYTNADVDVNGVDQSSDIDAFSVLGYGSMPVIDNKTKFLYQLGYSWQMTDTSRQTLTGDATADYTSNVASVDAKLIRDYQINNNWLLQPTLGLAYIHFSAPSYSESKAGVANLDVDRFSTSETLLNIGLVSNYKTDESSRFLTTLDVGYDLQDKNDKVASTTQGGLRLADAESIDNGRVSYAIGVGYEQEVTKNSNINFTYEYSGEGSDYTNNTVSAKYVVKF